VKVLVITNLFPPEFLGGYELGCAQMVDALRSVGHDVRVLTSASAHAYGQDEYGVDRVLGMPPIYNRALTDTTPPAVNTYFDLLACTVNPANVRVMGDVVEEYQPDVAYLWNVLGLGGLGVLALLDHQGIPWVWHLMDLIPRQITGFGTSGPEIGRELGRVFPGRYIACSRHVVGEILEGGVDLGDRVEIIPNWVFGDRPPRRTEFFAGGELRVLTASGTLCESKGTNILIESAALLRDRGFVNFTIDIYGHDQDMQYRTLLHTHDVADMVRLMGPRRHQDLLELYNSYDVFSFPTWSREPFGFAPLEAAAAGCVPLFTDDCGIAEWLIGGVDCLKAPRSTDGFALGMEQILRGEIDLSAIGRRAQAVAWREFHISAAAAKVEAILAEAATERCTARGNSGEFYRLARFAEGVIHALLQEQRPTELR